MIACNTVSATCIPQLQRRWPQIPIVGIIQPAAERIVKSCSIMNKIGIIGTKVTIQSGAYREQIQSLNDELDIYQTPCPAFVPLIEEGIIQNDIMDLTIKYYMEDFILENRLDTIVLGCTHYPLIRSNIKRLYPSLRIINPSEEIVYSIRRVLKERDMFAGDFEFENVFYASDLSENFVNMIDRIFHDEEIKVKFKNLELEEVEEGRTMNFDKLLEYLGITEPGEFEYFENMADLVEAEAEIPSEAVFPLLRELTKPCWKSCLPTILRKC